MDFTLIIFGKIPNNDKNKFWVSRYIKFIQLFNLDKKIKNKTHNHHILPKTIFPEYSNLKQYKNNSAHLSYRAHYIAHFMLGKIFGTAMWIEFSRMSNNRSINSVLYSVGVENHSIYVSGEGNPMYGKKHTIDTKIKMSKWQLGLTYEEKYGKEKALEIKNKISESMTGLKHSDEVNKKKGRSGSDNSRYGVKIEKENHPMYGKKHSEETKDKMSKAKEGYVPWIKDRGHSEESKEKMRKPKSEEAKKNMRQAQLNMEKIVCIHCGKEVKKNVHKRFHGNKCKNRSNI